MRRKGAAAAVLLGVPSVLLGLAASLGMSPAFADCTANTFCLYATAGYHDTQWKHHPTSTCVSLSGSENNNANAMRNYNNFKVEMWDLPGCGGSSHYTAQANSYDSDFDNNSFSNKASSFRRVN